MRSRGATLVGITLALSCCDAGPRQAEAPVPSASTEPSAPSAPATASAAPEGSTPRPLARPIRRLDAKGNLVCATDAEGRLVCWTGPDDRSTGPPPPWAADDAEDDCVVSASGAAACQPLSALGDRSVHPVERAPVPGLGPVAEVASGRSLRCARSVEGAVWCWGDADWRRLAGGGAPGFFAHPSKVPELPRATAIAAGSRHACAIVNGGAVWCWGRVTGGIAGLAGARCPMPKSMQAPKSLVESVCLTAVLVEPLPKARLIAASLEHTCVVDEGDAIWCWGGQEPGRPPGPFTGGPARLR